MTQVGGRH